jgi:hypothetical protein
MGKNEKEMKFISEIKERVFNHLGTTFLGAVIILIILLASKGRLTDMQIKEIGGLLVGVGLVFLKDPKGLQKQKDESENK